MKRVVLMSMDNDMIEWSPAKYQLLDGLKARGFETYVILPDRLKNRSNIASIDHAINTKKWKAGEIRKKIIEINPQVVIATLYMDTAIIYPLPYIMKNTSFYYYNLEVYTPYINKEIMSEDFKRYIDYKLRYPFDKIKEILYTRAVKGFTIQDPLRRKLARKYHVWHPNTIYVPNSYVFDESKLVPEGREGVIYSGGIKRNFLVQQFDDLKKVQDIPIVFTGIIDPWCLKRIKNLKRTNPNLKFVQQVLSINEYTDYVRRFAIGLVWYSPLKEDEEHYCIGLSSGKMFKHLSLGQPIIAVACPGITEAVNKYKLGVVINNIAELPEAYKTIMENYSDYQKNVIETYRMKFDFKKRIEPFLEWIEKAM